MLRGYSVIIVVNPTISPAHRTLQTPNILSAAGCLPDTTHGGIGSAQIAVPAPHAVLKVQRCLYVKTATSHAVPHVTLEWILIYASTTSASTVGNKGRGSVLDAIRKFRVAYVSSSSVPPAVNILHVHDAKCVSQMTITRKKWFPVKTAAIGPITPALDSPKRNAQLLVIQSHQKCFNRKGNVSMLQTPVMWYRHGSLSILIPMILNDREMHIVFVGWHPRKHRQRTRFLFRISFNNKWNIESVQGTLDGMSTTAKTISATYRMLARSNPVDFKRIFQIFNAFRERLKSFYQAPPAVHPIKEKPLPLQGPPLPPSSELPTKYDSIRLKEYVRKWKKPIVIELKRSLAEQQVFDKVAAVNNRNNLQLHPHRHLHVRRSHIAGFGLFTSQAITAGTKIFEYCGELIGQLVADRRELLYGLLPLRRHDCYLFRLSDDRIIDATLRANAARFINHSCAPNCESKVICSSRIVIVALRDISMGEELSYDYKLSSEGVEDVAPCYCGALECRKFMN
ncbi:hypothetical protein PSACC_01016 [Paramicrosporidium saccamoebae]|uniref:SET domain-containing protein n=1 Tax=Paramicrosporidium saccamoebae TaxID=1246581 RepID=A0A2H9TN49_9FUNG|nr:hypothetical protein PSACC_01016 [Paramicrosporidium saccamoebae]